MIKNLNPYFLLGVTPEAGDDEIAEAYEQCLKAIKKDKDTEAEESLHMAFEKIKTEADRIRFDLFDVSSNESSPQKTFIECARWMRRQNRLQLLGMEDLRALFGSLIGPQAHVPSSENAGSHRRNKGPRHPVKDHSSERLSGRPAPVSKQRSGGFRNSRSRRR